MNTRTDSLHQAIQSMMTKETLRIVDEEAKLAAVRVEERVRAMSGQIATRVASFVEFQTERNRIVITVNIPPTQQQ